MTWQRQFLRDGALAGLLVALSILGLLALASVLRLTTFAPLDIANTIIALTPGALATATIETLGKWGMRLLVLAAGAGFLLSGALCGILCAWLLRRRPAASAVPAWLTAGMGCTLLLLLPIAALQLLVPANRATAPPPSTSLPVLGLIAILAGAGLGALLRGLSLRSADELDPAGHSRRAFLRTSTGAALSLALSGLGLAWLLPAPAPKEAGASLPPVARPPATPTLAVPTTPPPTSAPTVPAARPATPTPTPLPAFVPAPGTRAELTEQRWLYVISSSTRDPVIDPQSWRLKVHGAVRTPFELTYAELLALPRYDQISTLECISNEVGNYLIGNCRWNGVRLRDLLERAGAEPGVVDVVLHAADGYSDSLPLALALDPATLVAYGIDDQALEVSHGFPARIRVPPLYGVKNVKWLTEIELVGANYLGYWQQRGWTDDATIATTSVFDTGNPYTSDGKLMLRDGLVALGGIAFAGSRGIRTIELQIDDGAWQPARLKEALSDLSWRLWRYDWQATPGLHTLKVRAVDGSGELQTAELRDTHPDGATGYHVIKVEVTEG